jgi:hypothetical protein
MGTITRQQLMSKLAILRNELSVHRIRNTSDYAEVLVAEALNAQRIPNGVNQGYDLISSKYGRIEVKCRMLPTDGRIEERVDLKGSKIHGFDYLAIVIFYPDFGVKGSILVPYDNVWPIVDSRPYRRISYGEACQLHETVDITELVSSAAHR